jgi:glutaredoxin 3
VPVAILTPYHLGPLLCLHSWQNCPFCKKAKALLDSLGARYTAVELDTLPDGKALRAELARMTDRTSVPNVFISGRTVGGCQDGPGVVTLHQRGELVPLLKSAGAL